MISFTSNPTVISWIIISLVSLTIAVLTDIITKLIEKIVNKEPQQSRLGLKKQLFIILGLFVIFLTIQYYLQYYHNIGVKQWILPTETPSPDTIWMKKVKVKVQDTVICCNNELSISVQSVYYTADEVSLTVNATIGSPGYENVIIAGKEIGYSVRFQARNLYDIRVAKIPENLNYPLEFVITLIDPKDKSLSTKNE